MTRHSHFPVTISISPSLPVIAQSEKAFFISRKAQPKGKTVAPSHHAVQQTIQPKIDVSQPLPPPSPHPSHSAPVSAPLPSQRQTPP